MALSDPLLPASASGRGPVVDVVIAGAGPVGLFAAIELASRGCTVRLIDPLLEPEIKTKASGIAGRSMEVLPKPVVESILKNSCHVQRARIFEVDAKGERTELADVSMEGVRGYHGMRSQQQWQTEKMLTEHLSTLGISVLRGVALDTFSETATGVECELKAENGAVEHVTAKFLLGCDGGRSTIRKKLGFSFEGEATAEYFFALHAGFEGGDTKPDETVISCSKSQADVVGKGFCFSMPMPDGGFLVTCDLDDEQQAQWKTGEVDRNGLPVLKQPEPEDVAMVLSKRGMGAGLRVKPGTVKWIAHFRVQSRQAEHYGKGRVYLAGDACHCHSPLGGQGMNMGFQDAKNIAWKLGWAAKGLLPISTLATYEGERRELEKKICHAIENGQKAMSQRNPVAMFIRGRGQRIGPAILQFTGKLDNALAYAAQTAWSYRGSKLAVEHWERPAITPSSICPAGGFRRRQNLYRWIGTRLHAGDTVPDAPAPGGKTIQGALKEGRGWTLLLFEGEPEANADNSRFLSDAKTLSVDELRMLAESLTCRPDAQGFVAGIDVTLVLPYGECKEAHEVFGVRGQCLFLVRPDFHVGLRSEPVRAGAVYRYFAEACNMTAPPMKVEQCPASSPTSDMFPSVAWGVVAALLIALVVTGRDGGHTSLVRGAMAVACLVFVGISFISRPPS